MLNSIRWTVSSPESDQVPGITSTGASNRDECAMKQEAPQSCVEVEDSRQALDSPQASTNGVEEPEWSGVSAAAARAGLYDEHEVKRELVLGPERLQPQDIAVTLAVASNRADKDLVEQKLVHNVVKIESPGESASPAQNVHLNGLLEQLVHSTCYVMLERTPVSKEPTCQTPHKSLDLPSLMSDRNKRTEETDVERDIHQETKVHTKRKSYICDFCGKQFAQKAYLIKHIHIHMQQNFDILRRWSSEQFKVKHKLIKQQCPRSVESLGKRVALRTCCVRLQRVPIDKHLHKAVDQLDNGYVSTDSAVDSKIMKKTYCDICDKDFSSFNYLKIHISKHLWEEQFVCEICKQKFSEKCHLNKHIEEVHTDQEINQSENVYSCKFCKKVLSSKRSLMIHERMHTGEKPFSCNVCKKQFVDKNSLFKHMRLHTGEKPFTCKFCLKKFAESGQMTTHMRIHNTGSEKHTCKICQKQCFSLKSHMVIHTGEKPYVCEFCGKAFSNNGTLHNHWRLHKTEEYFACNVCRRRFRLQENLDRHKQSCTLFTCDICMKQFRRRTCLRDHKRGHAGERPYACDICKKQFRLKQMIISHIETHMGKSYECEICHKQFANSRQKTQHRRRVHSEELFSCDICQKQFKTKDSIHQHQRTHTGEKPYECKICQKRFTNAQPVSKHEKIHSEKPFTCDSCKRSFKTKYEMVFHIQTHIY